MDLINDVVTPVVDWASRNLVQLPDVFVQQVSVNFILTSLSRLPLFNGGLFRAEKRLVAKSEVSTTVVSEPKLSSLLTCLRQSETQVDSLRRNVHRCECDTSKSCSVYCNHKYKLTQLSVIADRLDLLFAQLPLSDERLQQHIEELWKCINTLGLAVAKYGEGIDIPGVLPLCYKVENNDVFQQRFKAAIIGIEACLA